MKKCEHDEFVIIFPEHKICLVCLLEQKIKDLTKALECSHPIGQNDLDDDDIDYEKNI